MSGYIKLHRRLRSHPLFEADHNARHFFQDLLSDIAWKDTVQDWKGTPVKIGRGQVMKSQRAMADEYGFSHRETRTILNRLAKYEIIKIDTPLDRGPCIVSVCNWDKYQDRRHTGDTPLDTQATHRRHTKEEEEEVRERSNRDANASLVADRDESEVDHDLLSDDLKPAKATRTSLPIVESFNAYQETALRCGIAQARALTPAIRRSINARLKEYGPNGWADCLANIERSAFLCGHTEKSDFRVSLPWMLKPANFEKIVSGVYGNGRHAEKIPETDAASLYEKLIAGAQS